MKIVIIFSNKEKEVFRKVTELDLNYYEALALFTGFSNLIELFKRLLYEFKNY